MNIKDEQNHGLSERKTTLNLFFLICIMSITTRN